MAAVMSSAMLKAVLFLRSVRIEEIDWSKNHVSVSDGIGVEN